MFDPDYAFDAPNGRELLAIAGIDPAAVREVAEHDRAMRCPDRASLRSLRGAAVAGFPGTIPALPLAE